MLIILTNTLQLYLVSCHMFPKDFYCNTFKIVVLEFRASTMITVCGTLLFICTLYTIELPIEHHYLSVI